VILRNPLRTAHTSRLSKKELASEIIESLGQGDHVRHDKQRLRALCSLLVLVIAPVWSIRHRYSLPTALEGVVLVVANPVAHGSRLARSVMDALAPLPVSLVLDSRLSDPEIAGKAVNFPGVTVRSLIGFVRVRDLLEALELRLFCSLKHAGPPGMSRLYLEALFFIQAIRYSCARSLVESQAGVRVWLSDFDRASFARPLIWHASSRGWCTATLVHGTPNENYVPPVAANVFVWGEAQRDWFAARAQSCVISVVGRPEFQHVLVPEEPRRLRIVHSLEKLSALEEAALRTICAEGQELGLHLSLRLHPSASDDELDPCWQRAVGDIRREDRRKAFHETLHTNDVVVGVLSTALVDALTLGIPALTIADSSRTLPCDLEVLRQYPSLDSLGLAATINDVTGIRDSIIAAIGEDAGIRIRTLMHELLASADSL
jgi:hypothetical protein